MFSALQVTEMKFKNCAVSITKILQEKVSTIDTEILLYF